MWELGRLGCLFFLGLRCAAFSCFAYLYRSCLDYYPLTFLLRILLMKNYNLRKKHMLTDLHKYKLCSMWTRMITHNSHRLLATHYFTSYFCLWKTAIYTNINYVQCTVTDNSHIVLFCSSHLFFPRVLLCLHPRTNLTPNDRYNAPSRTIPSSPCGGQASMKPILVDTEPRYVKLSF